MEDISEKELEGEIVVYKKKWEGEERWERLAIVIIRKNPEKQC